MGWLGKIVGEITGSGGVERVADRASQSSLQVSREASALNRERWGEAQQMMSPYLKSAETARNQLMVEAGLAPGEAGTAYMKTPGYQQMMEERRAEVNQAAADAGGLYSGRRLSAAADVGSGVQSQFYSNYMNLLQNLGNPQIATNMASMGMGQAAQQGQIMQQGQNQANAYLMQGAEATQAGRADLLGGLIKGGASFFGAGGGM